MKKCVRCEIIFHSDNRLYCLYCDSRLMDASVDEIFHLSAQVTPQEKILKSQETLNTQRLQYLVGSYFRTRSFPFLYSLSRNQFKMDKMFKRFLIQPIDFSAFVKIPWLFINIIDSLILRIAYTGFCQECNWKHKKITSQGEHTKQECEYNREYSTILRDILNGEIIKNETKHEKEAARKMGQGQKSAYHELCTRKRDFEAFLDIVTILSSIALIIFVIVRLTMPIFGAIYDF